MQFARVYYSPNNWPTPVESADLYFAGGKPLLVRSWQMRNGRRVPGECVELDPQKLQRASANGTVYRYDGPVNCAG